MSLATAPKTPARAKQLAWTEDDDGILRCCNFEMESVGCGRYVLWHDMYWLCEGTLAVCRECAEAFRVLMDRRRAEIERRRDERIDEIEYEAEELLYEEEQALIAQVSKEFAAERRRKKPNAR